MKLIIDISEKEFGVEIADHFQDFFRRIKAEIEERLISNDTLVCGNYELEIVEMFLKSFKNATLEQEPKTDVALERYKDLQNYFGDEDIAKTVLENQTEFKAWLERLHWNTKKVDELARKVEALEQEPRTEPKTGHWISRWYGDKHFHVCSECQEEFSHDAETGIEIINYHICPNCGAKMGSEV